MAKNNWSLKWKLSSNIKDNSTSFGSSIENIILEKVTEFSFPIVFNFPSGHEDENVTIPLGVNLNLDVEAQKVSLYS